MSKQPPPPEYTPALAFERFLKIIHTLREECPWDRKQTMASLRHLTIEECYELSDAILEGNLEEVKKELGDVLLHLLFYARIASEQGVFTITEAINDACEKLIRRHPHIYGNAEAKDAQEVRKNWEELKLKEGAPSTLSGVPASLPTLLKAMRIQEKAQAAGFGWHNNKQVIAKIHEELNELDAEINFEHVDMHKVEEEFGDFLFSLVSYAHFLHINPDDALEKANKKFIARFQQLESLAQKKGFRIKDMPAKELDELWNEIKKT